MRKIISGFFMSLDGVVEAPDQWHFSYFNDEMGESVGNSMANTDAMLMGRVMYDEWSEHWPNATPGDSFTDYFNNVKKYAVSTTLTSADWNNTEILSGLDAVRELKNTEGGDIGMSGSTALVRSLLAAGLIDELRLLVHPIVVGHGAKLFDGLDTIHLDLVSSKTFKTGVLELIYAPGEAPSEQGHPELPNV